MAFENWDWEDFAEGIATSIGPGITTGINLRKAGADEQKRRIDMAESTYSPYIDQEIERRQPARPTPDTSFGMFRDEPTFATPSGFGTEGGIDVGLPEVDVAPVSPINLMSAREARDRERAAGMYSFSPEAKKFLESLSDEELSIAKSRRQRKEAEVTGGTVKELSNKYHVNNLAVERAGNKMAAINARLRTETDPDRITQLEDEKIAVMKAGRAAEALVAEAMEAMSRLGIGEDDLETIRQPEGLRTGQQRLIEKATGGTKTRSPGARGR